LNRASVEYDTFDLQYQRQKLSIFIFSDRRSRRHFIFRIEEAEILFFGVNKPIFRTEEAEDILFFWTEEAVMLFYFLASGGV
jgi:hypothetical protein